MSDFNLDKAIKNWRKKLEKYPDLEPGYIEELEAHLRDKIDYLLAEDFNLEEAFLKASEDVTGGLPEVIEEFRSSRTNGKNPPVWKSRSWVPSLLPNYLKVTFRNVWRNKGYAFINILGLAIGITSCILILLYVNDEFNYDQFHEKSDRIYRVLTDTKWGDQEGVAFTSPPPLGRIFTEEIAGVKSFVRFYKPQEQIVRNNDIYFKEEGIFAADSTFFDMFSFELLEGNPETALKQPYSMVITPKIARKYFSDERALDQSLRLGEDQNAYTITGIVAPPPSNSHIQFDILTSIYTYDPVDYFDWSWVWNGVATYVMLHEQAEAEEAQAQIPDIVEANLPATFKRIGFSFEELIENGGHWNYRLQPLSELWLYSSAIGNPLGGSSNILYIYILGTAAIFILIIACINFMNLATARSTNRGKEVGIRKTLGSSRKVLAGQFLSESVLYSIAAALLACLLINLVLPGFNNLASKDLSFSLFDEPWVYGGLALLTLFVGLLSGSYPALALSSYKPVDVLKGNLRSGSKGKRLRHILVVGQFAISLVLIIGTLIVYAQLDYMQSKDIGLDKGQVIVIKNGENLYNQQETFRRQLAGMEGIISASLASNYPTKGDFTDFYHPLNAKGTDLMISSLLTDRYFIETMGIELIAGRNFREESAVDQRSVIINKKTAQSFGWFPDEAIGQKIVYPGGDYQTFTVVGVMENFNYYSLMNPVPNFAFFHRSSKSYTVDSDYVVAKIAPNRISETLDAISSQWENFRQNVPFEYVFLDDQFDALYRSQQRMGIVFGVFTTIAILVACMGLLGLVTFATEQRTREIGIRKVFGATSANIVLLLSKDFAKLTGLAFLIACPIAWYLMKQWLQDFAYSITIGPGIFLAAGFATMLVVLATISFQSLRAALSNPVKSLRSE